MSGLAGLIRRQIEQRHGLRVGDSMPADVRAAVTLVQNYFASQHVTEWEFDGLQSRRGTGLDPEMGFILEGANKGELAAYDQACAEANAAVQRVLDGKDTGQGVCNESWATLRERLRELVRYRNDYPGEVVVTYNENGQIVAVTRQDEDGKVLKVIAQAKKQ